MAEVVSSGLWNQELPRSATSLHCRRRRHNAHTSTSARALHPRNLRSGPAGMLTFVARPPAPSQLLTPPSLAQKKEKSKWKQRLRLQAAALCESFKSKTSESEQRAFCAVLVEQKCDCLTINISQRGRGRRASVPSKPTDPAV